MRVGFHTFGCKLNQYETEGLAQPFARSGFTVVPASEDADLYVINTCTVTTRADHKARALIRSVSRRRPDAAVIVTGCSAQLEAAGLAGLGANVAVVPQAEKALLLDLPALFAASGPSPTADELIRILRARSGTGCADPFRIQASEPSFHTRAYLKIQDGCDSRCAYCRVPLARGPSVSLACEEVLRRARDLEERGFREIVITGVNISAYRSGTVALAGLLEGLLARCTVPRFRLSSLEPEALAEGLAAVLSHDRVCPHFHIPVQSGSDKVLKSMRRRYDSARVREGVRLLRGAKGDPFLAADLLAGFPGESAEDFALTRDLVVSEGFAALHVFPYSPRPGTDAVRFPRQVPERVRDERAALLGELSRSLPLQYAARWAGRDAEVLLEGARPRGTGWPGVSANYLRVSVAGVPPDEPGRGRMVVARLAAPGMGSASGRISGDFIRFVD